MDGSNESEVFDAKQKSSLLIRPIQFSSIGVTQAIKVKSKICLIKLNCLEIYDISENGLIISSVYTFSDTLIDLVEYNTNFIPGNDDDLGDKYLIILTKRLDLFIFDIEKSLIIEKIEINSPFPVISNIFMKVYQNFLFVFSNLSTFLLVKLDVKVGKRKSIILSKNTLTIDYIDMDQLDILMRKDTNNILIAIKSIDNNLWFYNLNLITLNIDNKYCFSFNEKFYFMNISNSTDPIKSEGFLLLLFNSKQSYFPLPGGDTTCDIFLHNRVFEKVEIKDKISKGITSMISLKITKLYPIHHLLLKNSTNSGSGNEKCQILLSTEDGRLFFIGVESSSNLEKTTHDSKDEVSNDRTMKIKKDVSFWNLNRRTANKASIQHNSHKCSTKVVIKDQVLFELEKQNCLIECDSIIIQLTDLCFLSFSTFKKNSCIFKVVQSKTIELVQYFNQFGHGSILDAEIIQKPFVNSKDQGFLSQGSGDDFSLDSYDSFTCINGNLLESEFKYESKSLNLLNVSKVALDLRSYSRQLVFETSYWPIILVAYKGACLKIFQFDNCYTLINSYSCNFGSSVKEVFKPDSINHSFFILFENNDLQKRSFSLSTEGSLSLSDKSVQVLQKNDSLYYLTKDTKSIVKINLNSLTTTCIISMSFPIKYFDLLVKDKYLKFIIFYMNDNTRRIINLLNLKTNDEDMSVKKELNSIKISKISKNSKNSKSLGYPEFRNINNSISTFINDIPYFFETTIRNELKILNLRDSTETKVLLPSIYDIFQVGNTENMFFLNGRNRKILKFDKGDETKCFYRVLDLKFDSLSSSKSDANSLAILHISKTKCVCYNKITNHLEIYRFMKSGECKVIIFDDEQKDSENQNSSKKFDTGFNSDLMASDGEDIDEYIVTKKRRGNKHISFEDENGDTQLTNNNSITLSSYRRYDVMNSFEEFDSLIKIFPFKGIIRCHLYFEKYIIVVTNEFSSSLSDNNEKDISTVYLISKELDLLETLAFEDEIITCMVKGEYKKPEISFFDDMTSISLQSLLKKTVIMASTVTLRNATTTGSGEDIINVTKECKISLLSISEEFKITVESDISLSNMKHVSSLFNYGFRVIFITSEDCIQIKRMNYLPSSKSFTFIDIAFPIVNLSAITKIEAVNNTIFVNDLMEGLFIFKIEKISLIKKDIALYTVSDYTYKNNYEDYQDSLGIEFQFGRTISGNFVDFNILDFEHVQTLDCDNNYRLFNIVNERVSLEQHARFENDYLNFVKKVWDFEKFDKSQKIMRLGIMGSLLSVVYEVLLINDSNLYKNLFSIQKKLIDFQINDNDSDEADTNFINGVIFMNYLKKVSTGADNVLNLQEKSLVKQIFSSI